MNAVWAMAALAFLIGLPMIYSLSVFNALVSISSIGCYVSCEAPSPAILDADHPVR